MAKTRGNGTQREARAEPTATQRDAETARREPAGWTGATAPPASAWDDWVELDAGAWPRREERHRRCIPTLCFNCEAGCGLLAYVDKASGEIVRFEGNPHHPGSRGRTCAKGPATLNQVRDPERILYPLRRTGARGEGRWERVSWDAVLDDLGGRIRTALDEGRHDEIMYHVGRPGDDHFVPRLLQAWGIDGHNSHTNVCSASARLGYALTMGADRPSPDYANAQFVLLLSAHLETGHYFNPHAQRIMDAKQAGARLAVVDTRLSNTASHADLWISPWPGTEAVLLLGVAHELLESDRIDREFLRRWTNWEEVLRAHGDAGDATATAQPADFDAFLRWLRRRYARYTPEFVAAECRIDAGAVPWLADAIAAAGSRFASHLWRNTASGNLGGWQVARALMLLHALSGSIGTPGGVDPNAWDKFVPRPSTNPPAGSRWNELLFPREFPLSHYEMSFLLPHLLEATGRRLDVYFTRVYNPVWTNPDGSAWIDMFAHPDRIGCHVALTPIWSETAQWADYVLPMGLGPERHDLVSQETHAGTWIGFRQPVLREHRRREAAAEATDTRASNPGEVWEEAEFWIALTHRIDADGSRGIRRWYTSPRDSESPITLDEYYADIFEKAVPGLPEAARAEGLTPLEYMRRYGAYEVPYAGQRRNETPVPEDAPGVEVDGRRVAGFGTPSRKIELHSPTLADWGFPEHCDPDWIPSHVHWRALDLEAGERLLLPTFRLPTLIHTRSGNAKWLQEISHTNPLWVHPDDAARLGLANGELARVQTRIGWFVPRVWVTEGIHPGVVACSHHLGRWRLHREVGGERLSSAQVALRREGDTYRMRVLEPVGPYASSDPDTRRIWWRESGVNQNMTFPVQPDPVSGMHCWHQKVVVKPAEEGDRAGDLFVDRAAARDVFHEWMAQARPGPGPDGLRRPRWLNRPLRPRPEAYRL